MIIGVTSKKGGTGKSTTAIHIATLLAQKQHKKPCLVIDADAQRSLLAWANRGELPFKVIDEELTGKYAKDYENIIIDTRGDPPPRKLAALVEWCDQIIVVTDTSIMSLDTLPEFLDELAKLKCTKHRMLITKVNPVSKPTEIYQLFDSLGVSAFNSYIRRFAVYEKAAREGAIVSQVKDDYAEAAWQDYTELGRELFK